MSPQVSPSQAGWAEVRARGEVVRYRRSGSGRPVLLLHAQPEAHPLWPELLEMLTAEFRLIMPAVPAAETDVHRWFSALADGLGLSNFTVVASDEFCIPVLQRALTHPDHVSAIILLCAGRGSDDLLSGMLATTTQLPAVPLLLLHRDRPAMDVLPVLVEFLKRVGEPVRA
jgi:pimeloyl-ACP methyl ester carboxylesterase